MIGDHPEYHAHGRPNRAACPLLAREAHGHAPFVSFLEYAVRRHSHRASVARRLVIVVALGAAVMASACGPTVVRRVEISRTAATPTPSLAVRIAVLTAAPHCRGAGYADAAGRIPHRGRDAGAHPHAAPLADRNAVAGAWSEPGTPSGRHAYAFPFAHRDAAAVAYGHAD